jgi:hypothetical protein
MNLQHFAHLVIETRSVMRVCADFMHEHQGRPGGAQKDENPEISREVTGFRAAMQRCDTPA